MPAVPYKNPNNYVKNSGRLAKAMGGVWANQFDNVANRQAMSKPQLRKSGHRPWQGGRHRRRCRLRGTLAGVSLGLKAKNKNVRIALADPMGPPSSATTRLRTEIGRLLHHGSIGQGRITKNLEGIIVDDAFQIADDEALTVAFELLEHEGLCMGGSTGVNVQEPSASPGRWGPGHTIVDHPLRLRHALCLQDLQSRLPALKKSARAEMAGSAIHGTKGL